jgi:hypothetical protein
VPLAAGDLPYGLAMGMSNSHEMSYRRMLTHEGLQDRSYTSMHSLKRAVMIAGDGYPRG